MPEILEKKIYKKIKKNIYIRKKKLKKKSEKYESGKKKKSCG